MDYQWNTDNTITIEPPKRPKKMTGTRFASVLGLNPWNTPFQQWCEITKAYNIPFEDTKYTLAGKAIEPIQIQYMRDMYGMEDELVVPADIWGDDYFKKTWGNFFTHPVLGGMWDALCVSEDWDGTPDGLVGHTDMVLEFKTTKRVEDWLDENGEAQAPEYYALQAALYAYLLECDDVVMVGSFLEDGDYDHPNKYVPSAENTVTVEFKVSERYPDFEESYVKPALAWWNEHVATGNSPEYDERLDAEYLSNMRNTSLNPDTDIDAILDELADLNNEVSIVEKQIAGKQKRIKAIKAQLKKYAEENISDEDDTATIENERVKCTLTKTYGVKVDEAAMKEDGVFEKYAIDTESTRFNVKFL